MRKLIIVLFFWLCVPQFAQSPNWTIIPSITSLPPSYLSEWERNKNQTLVTLNYTGLTPVEYRVEIVVKRADNAKQIVKGTSPLYTFAGPGVRVIYATDFLNWPSLTYDNTAYQQILRTNQFPEGGFNFDIVLRDPNGNQLGRETTPFVIWVPAPPQLIEPANASAVIITHPVFQWTLVSPPAGRTAVYKFTLVERNRGQSALNALQRNTPRHTADVTNASSYVYPLDALPLENGKQYVWQVRMLDQSGAPISSNNGYSEYYEFTFGESSTTAANEFTRLDLITDVAWVTNFNGLNRVTGTNTISFSGRATLYLKLSDGVTKEVPATFDNLTFRKNVYNPFSFVSGKVTAAIPTGTLSTDVTGTAFTPSSLEFTPTGGLVLKGSVKLFEYADAPTLTPEVKVLAGGILQDVPMQEVQQGSNGAIFMGPLAFGVMKAGLSFSGSNTFFPAKVPIVEAVLASVSGGIEGLETYVFSVPQDGLFNGHISFSSKRMPMPVGATQQDVSLLVNNAEGAFSINTRNKTATWDVNLSGRMSVAIQGLLTTSGDVVIHLRTAGITAEQQNLFSSTVLTVNWFKVNFSAVKLTSLSFSNTGFKWSYSLSASADYSFTMLNNLSAGPFAGAVIDQDGIKIPAVPVTPFSLSGSTGRNFQIINGSQLAFESFQMRPLNIPNGGAVNPDLSVNLGLQFTLPSGSAGSVPLAAKGNLAGLSASYRSPSPLPQAMAVALSDSAVFAIRQYAYTLSTTSANSTPELQFAVKVKGSLQLANLAPLFAAARELDFREQELAMEGSGKLSGSVLWEPPVSLKLGLFPLTRISYPVVFGTVNGRNSVLLNGSAQMDLSPLAGAASSVRINFQHDLLANALVSISGTKPEAVALNYPYNAPQFQVLAPRLSISKSGITIPDGNLRLFLGQNRNKPVTAQSDGAMLGFENGLLVAGKITCSDEIGILVNLANGNNAPVYSVEPAEQTYPTGNALRITSWPIELSAAGLSGLNSSNSFLRSGTTDYRLYSSNFYPIRFTFAPMKIADGEFAFTTANQRTAPVIATLNKSGFSGYNAAGVSTTGLPTILPLHIRDAAGNPRNNKTAYFYTSRVNVTTEGANWHITGQNVQLYFPGLTLLTVTVPSLDITVNQEDYRLVNGSVSGNFPANAIIPELNLELTRFTYALESGSGALSFEAKPRAFGTQIGSQTVRFTMAANGDLNSSAFTFNPAVSIPVIQYGDPGSVLLDVSGVAGSVSGNMSAYTAACELTITAKLKIKTGDNSATPTYFGAAVVVRAWYNRVQRANLAEISSYTLDAINPTAPPVISFSNFKLQLTKFVPGTVLYGNNFTWAQTVVTLAGKPSFKISGDNWLALPEVQGITLGDDAGQRTAFNWPGSSSENLEAVSPSFAVGGAALKIRVFRTGVVSCPFGAAGITAADFRKSFDASVTFTNFGDHIDSRLKTVLASNVTVNAAGQFSGSIAKLAVRNWNVLAYAQKINLGTAGCQLWVKELEGTIGAACSLTIKARIVLPSGIRSFKVQPGDITASVSANGVITSTKQAMVVGNNDRLTAGTATVLATENSVIFSKDNTGKQTAVLAVKGDFSLPLNTKSVPATATGLGDCTFDLLTGTFTLKDVALNITKFGLPFDKPVFVFATTKKTKVTYGTGGLKFDGDAEMQILGRDAVPAYFSNFLLKPGDFTYSSGQFTINKEFALYGVQGDDEVAWTAKDTAFIPNNPDAVLIKMPTGFIVKANAASFTAVALSDSFAVKLRFNSKDEGLLKVRLEEGLIFSYDGFAPTAGKLSFFRGQERLAWIDKTGLRAGNLLALANVPDSIALPSFSTAYLRLKSEGQLLVDATLATGGQGITIKLKDLKKPVKLVVPALRKTATEKSREFDVVLDNFTVSQDYRGFVGGKIEVSSKADTGLANLKNLGIPLFITKLWFSNGPTGYEFCAAGKVALPKVLASKLTDTMTIDKIGFANGKLAGTVSLGKVNDKIAPDPKYIKVFDAGTYGNIKIEGLSFTFGDRMEFKLSGDLKSKFFKTDTDTARMHFTAAYNATAEQFKFTVAPNDTGFNVGKFKLKPLADVTKTFITLEFDDEATDFKITSNAMITAPDISPGLSASIEGLIVKKSEVIFPSVSLTVPDRYQSFKLFGATVVLRDTLGKKAINFGYEKDVFWASCTGYMKFPWVKDSATQVNFSELKISSDGDITLGSAALQKQIDIIKGRAWVEGVTISAENKKFYLTVDASVKLPKPAPDTKQKAKIKIGSDGSISGDATIAVLDDPEYRQDNVGNTVVVDSTEYKLGPGMLDLHYLGIKLDFGNFRNTKLMAIVGYYFNSNEKYILLGKRLKVVENGKDKFTYEPGINIEVDGDVSFGNYSAHNCSEVAWNNLSLTIDKVIPEKSGDDYKFKLDGKLKAGLKAVEGELTFKGFGLSTTGDIDFPTIAGGKLSVKGIVSITVNKFAMSTDPTSIWVEGADLTNKTSNYAKVAVDNYVMFGGELDIEGVAKGGVDTFLVYKRKDGDINLIIKNANLSAKGGKATLAVDLTYLTEGSSFKFVVAGKGTFNQYSLVALGKIAYLNNKVSAGIFVAVTGGLTIRLTPAVVVTGLGGGFFINPEASDMQKVRDLCEIKGKKLSKVEPDAKFAVLLYARISVAKEGTIDGRVLIKVTDQSFALDGAVTFLGKKDDIKGSFSLYVKFTEVFAEGNVDVEFNFAKGVLTGDGSVGFFVYGTKNWGVYGKINFNLVKIIQGQGEFAVGNSGFYASMTLQQSFNVWIVSISGGITLKTWYVPNVEWGGYFRVWIDAEILFGAIAAHGEVRGVAIVRAVSGSVEAVFAGNVSLSARLLFVSVSKDVWMKMAIRGDKGMIDAGFGRDREVETLLAKAENMSSKLQAAVTELKAINPIPDLQGVFTPAQIDRAAEFLAKKFWQAVTVTGDTGTAAADIYNALTYMTTGLTSTQNGDLKSLVVSGYPNLQDNFRINFYDKALAYRDYFSGRMFTMLRAGLKTKISELDFRIKAYNESIKILQSELTSFQSSFMPDTSHKTGLLEDPVGYMSYNPSPKDTNEQPAQFSVASDFREAGSQMGGYIDAAEAYESNMIQSYNKISATVQTFDALMQPGSKYLEMGNTYAKLMMSVDSLYAVLSYLPLHAYNAYSNTMYFNGTEIEDRMRAIHEVTNDWGRVKRSFKPVGYSAFIVNAILGTQNADTTGLWRQYEDKWNNTSGDLQLSMAAKEVGQMTTILNETNLKFRKAAPQLSANEGAARNACIAKVDEKQYAYSGVLESLFRARFGMQQTMFTLVDALYKWKERKPEEYRNQQPNLQTLNLFRVFALAGMARPHFRFGNGSISDSTSFAGMSVSWSKDPAYAPPVEYSVKFGKDEKYRSIGTTTGLHLCEIMKEPGRKAFSREIWVRAASLQGATYENKLTLTGNVGYSEDRNSAGALTTTPYNAPLDETPPPPFSVTIDGAEVFYSAGGIGGKIAANGQDYEKVPYAYVMKVNTVSQLVKVDAYDDESDITGYRVDFYTGSGAKFIITTNGTKDISLVTLSAYGAPLRFAKVKELTIPTTTWTDAQWASNSAGYFKVTAINGANMETASGIFKLDKNTYSKSVTVLPAAPNTREVPTVTSPYQYTTGADYVNRLIESQLAVLAVKVEGAEYISGLAQTLGVTDILQYRLFNNGQELTDGWQSYSPSIRAYWNDPETNELRMRVPAGKCSPPFNPEVRIRWIKQSTAAVAAFGIGPETSTNKVYFANTGGVYMPEFYIIKGTPPGGTGVYPHSNIHFLLKSIYQGNQASDVFIIPVKASNVPNISAWPKEQLERYRYRTCDFPASGVIRFSESFYAPAGLKEGDTFKIMVFIGDYSGASRSELHIIGDDSFVY